METDFFGYPILEIISGTCLLPHLRPDSLWVEESHCAGPLARASEAVLSEGSGSWISLYSLWLSENLSVAALRECAASTDVEDDCSR